MRLGLLVELLLILADGLTRSRFFVGAFALLLCCQRLLRLLALSLGDSMSRPSWRRGPERERWSGLLSPLSCLIILYRWNCDREMLYQESGERKLLSSCRQGPGR